MRVFGRWGSISNCAVAGAEQGNRCQKEKIRARSLGYISLGVGHALISLLCLHPASMLFWCYYLPGLQRQAKGEG